MDSAYRMIRWKQSVECFPDFGMTFGNPNFALCEANGAHGHNIVADAELVPTIAARVYTGGVHLVAVHIDYGENTRVLINRIIGQVLELER